MTKDESDMLSAAKAAIGAATPGDVRRALHDIVREAQASAATADRRALEDIAAILREPWTGETLDRIAAVARNAGYLDWLPRI